MIPFPSSLETCLGFIVEYKESLSNHKQRVENKRREKVRARGRQGKRRRKEANKEKKQLPQVVFVIIPCESK